MLALENVYEALALHMQGIITAGGALPQAKDIDAYITNPKCVGGFWAMGDFDILSSLRASIQVSVSLHEHAVQKIDKQVGKDCHYQSRSDFFCRSDFAGVGSPEVLGEIQVSFGTDF
ncbi:type II toxin-antitoxin system HicB family antitoxin [Pseudomonas sp. FSL R10-0399]|uniref:type II toxin-antitoxin system HicB family antitoxin n=1 Tax=Pseudomonas sp. FSL R10-0399 TaxID=2662194 RepID=UPI0021157EEB|nr:type II toxin-antitoxin system HicB family antitoxin [Pseudomonas sp. FSL R10-0399]